MIESLLDFQEEETLLQHHASKMGVAVDRTPKCHPELAGEGIEYAWGCAKGMYRRLPLQDKRSKTKFVSSVQKCIARNILTTTRCRKFARRAREYILAYLAMDCQSTVDNTQIRSVTNKDIEMVVKMYKTHRSAADFDKGFIETVVSEMNRINTLN